MKFKNFMMPMALVLAAGCYAADQGTKEDPLTIGTVQELLQFRNAVSDSGMYKGVKLKNAGEGLHFKLTADLDLSSVCGRDVGNWKAIGPFEGSFDGDGHKISNLYIDDSLGSVRDAGFIGPVFNNGDAYLWYSASKRKSFAPLHPNAVTYWNTIKDAHADGYEHIRFMDVGLPFRKNIYRDFILRFGGKEVSTYRWFYISIRWINAIASWLWRE